MAKDTKLREIKEVAQDLTGASLEVGISTVLENLPELGVEVTKIVGNEAVDTVIQTLTGGLIGAVAPVALGFKLSFQQKRFEKNIIKALDTITRNQTIIQQRLCALDEKVQQKFIDGPYRDALLDNIISENQEQKVIDNINGYINLMGVENPNDDFVFTFFHTLSQLSELDIRILRLYLPVYLKDKDDRKHFLDVMKEENIDLSQYNFIREKLCRLGMLDNENDQKRDKNLDRIGETLTELIKQLNAKKPKKVNEPKLNKIYRMESYRITNLGLQYLNFIDEPQ